MVPLWVCYQQVLSVWSGCQAGLSALVYVSCFLTMPLHMYFILTSKTSPSTCCSSVHTFFSYSTRQPGSLVRSCMDMPLTIQYCTWEHIDHLSHPCPLKKVEASKNLAPMLSMEDISLLGING